MTRLRSAQLVSLVLACALVTQGCATVLQATRTEARNDPDENGSESYRQGIRDTLTKLQRNTGLPVVVSATQLDSIHYVGPVMQEVWMPAQVVGGMVIPAHREWVVVRPGTWQVPDASDRPARATAQPQGKSASSDARENTTSAIGR